MMACFAIDCTKIASPIDAVEWRLTCTFNAGDHQIGMSTLRVQVGALVRHHRRRVGLSQVQLSEQAGRSIELIGRIERGAAAPSFETLEVFSKILKTPVRDFFGDSAFAVDAGRDDGLSRLLTRIANLDSEDLDWLDRLVSVALNRKVRSKALGRVSPSPS